MNKFWEWMDKNGYCVEENIYDRVWEGSTLMNETKFTVQMILGYMIEYLIDEKDIFIGMPTVNNIHVGIYTYHETLRQEIIKQNSTIRQKHISETKASEDMHRCLKLSTRRN